jgi:hypothetical protein
LLPAPRKPRSSGSGSSARSPIAACPWRAPARARFADRIDHLLTLDGIKLVIADDHKGLRAAARRVLSAGLQRCRVPWARNLLGHAAPEQRATVAAMVRTIFAQETKAEAFAQWDKVAEALRDRHDRLGALMDAARGRPRLHGLPQGALGSDREHEPARAGQQGDQAPGRRRRHLPEQ